MINDLSHAIEINYNDFVFASVNDAQDERQTVAQLGDPAVGKKEGETVAQLGDPPRLANDCTSLS